MTIHYQSEYTTLHLGDCLNILPTIPDASIDAIISDPPYPMIKRQYGMLTELEWSILMLEVCHQAQRVLKPTGSAVFILQPNSRKVGSMRGWLWEFMAWVCREWNMVQDVWWWNYATLPVGGAITNNLLRGSTKACVWCGPRDCYRNQDRVLWTESERQIASRSEKRTIENRKEVSASGRQTRRGNIAAASLRRGGVTPHNLLPMCNNDPEHNGSGAHGHGAGTPLPLADWWARYIAPPKSTILDPFVGAGTMGVAALLHGHKFIGIDKEAAYLNISRERCQEIEQQRRGEMHLRPRRSVGKTAPEGQMELWK